MVDPIEAAGDSNFTSAIESLWREWAKGTSLAWRMPKEFPLNVATQLNAVRQEREWLTQNIVIDAPIDFTPEQAKREITLVGLVMLRVPRILLWVETSKYSFELEGTGLLVSTLLEWYRALPEEDLLSLDDNAVKDYLLLSGVLTPCLNYWLDEIINYGMDHLIEKAMRSE